MFAERALFKLLVTSACCRNALREFCLGNERRQGKQNDVSALDLEPGSYMSFLSAESSPCTVHLDAESSLETETHSPDAPLRETSPSCGEGCAYVQC